MVSTLPGAHSTPGALALRFRPGQGKAVSATARPPEGQQSLSCCLRRCFHSLQVQQEVYTGCLTSSVREPCTMHCPTVVRSRIGGREMEQYTPYKSWFPLNVTTASLLVTRKEAESGTAEQTEKESRLGYKNSKGRIISSQRAKSQLSRRLLQGTCPFGNEACSEFAF